MNLNNFSHFFRWVVLRVSQISTFTIFFVGLGIILISVLSAGFYVPSKILAVFAASIGSSIGSAIISLTMPKLASILLDEERQQIKKEAERRALIEERLKSFAKLESEREKLQAEIERQKRMRIDVNSYRSILKLGVAELDNNVTDFKRVTLIEDNQDNWYQFGRKEKTEYVGVLNYKFKAFLGVDLTKLRFRALDNDTLEVSGLESEFQGMKDQKKEWLLREIRNHKHEGTILPESYEILSKDGRLVDNSDSQENELTDRINKGINFKNLDDHIIKMAKVFISLLFKPLGKSIIFETTQNLDGVGFIEYLEFHNIYLDTRIKMLEEEKAKHLFIPSDIVKIHNEKIAVM